MARGLQRDGAGVVAPPAALRRDAAAAHRHEASRSPGEEKRGPTASEKEVRVSGPARGGAAGDMAANQGGAVALNGEMIDEPVLIRARAVLARVV